MSGGECTRKLLRRREGNFLFKDAILADCSRIGSTVTGIDDDRREAPRGRRWFSRRLSRRLSELPSNDGTIGKNA
jgi:hypothetical protein